MQTLERIHTWAKACPDRIAYCYSDRSLSYAGLWDGAERLAAALRGREAPRVILYGGKEPEMLVGMLACLLAGKTYVPVSDDTPSERFDQILGLAQPCMVLTAGMKLLSADAHQINRLPDPALGEIPAEPELPAYLIFTSGSTGAPKGVPISRKNLDHFSEWICQLEPMKLPAPARVMNQASFSFDLSVADLYYSLCGGHTLFGLPKSAASDPAEIYAFLRENAIEASVCTPTFLKLCLLEPSFRAENLPSLKVVYSCGETLETGTAAKLLERFPQLRLINAYGPTEATSAVCAVEITSEMLFGNRPLPVGRLDNAACEITLSEDEIILKGESVFSGYFDGSMGGYFMENGLASYRTGDLGSIEGEFLYCKGRRDRQIKWKGYRIELDEIEQVIQGVPGVINCAVVAKRTNTGVVRLIKAFLVLEAGRNLDQIRKELALKLPDYMIPKSMVQTDQIPETENGKTDRKRLEAL